MNLHTDALPEIVWSADNQGLIHEFNSRWVEYTGLSHDQAAGWGWQSVVHPEDLEYFLHRWHQSLRSGEPLDAEIRLKKQKEGTYRWFVGRAFPLRDQARQTTRWTGVFTDIDRFKSADRAPNRTELTRLVSHDLKNPLTAIELNTSLLLRAAEEGQMTKVPRLAQSIRRSSRKMRRLIEDLLDIARIESGRLSLKFEAVEIEPMVDFAFQKAHELAFEREIRLYKEVAPGLPLVMCDRDRTEQLLLNVIENLLKLTPNAGALSMIAEQFGQEVRFSFEFSRIWDAINADTETKSLLGLSIAKGIIEAHGGKSWIQKDGPERHPGTTFIFTLPLVEQQIQSPTETPTNVISLVRH